MAAPERPNNGNFLSGRAIVRLTPEQEDVFIRAVEEIGVSWYGPRVVDIQERCQCRS